MAETFGEWRRPDSSCAGALALWLRDVVPGAGWGIVDHRGAAKVVWHHLRRALAPVAVWTIDEGLGGVDIHVANDGSGPVAVRLRVALYRGFEQRVAQEHEELVVAPHSSERRSVESLLGRFVDASWSYRFGPPGHDAIVASIEREAAEGYEVLCQAFRFPVGPPNAVESAESLGLEASMRLLDDGAPAVVVRTKRLAWGVRLDVPGFVPADDAFSVEPGGERVIPLAPASRGAGPSAGTLTALNLEGRIRLAPAGPPP